MLYLCIPFQLLFGGARSFFLSQRTDRLIVTGGCALVFIILLNSARLQKILSGRAWVRIGEVCYGIYLFHLLLLIVFGDFVVEFLTTNTPFSPGVAKMIVLLVVEASSIGLAFVSFFFD